MKETFWRLGSPRSRCWQIQCLVKCLMRTYFLVHRQPSFHCVLTWWKGPGSSLESLYKGTNPIPEGSTLMN
uniref:Uncharacterized protein n=1 Tax=Catagonus wagneri TaxID=51154 RepID=A0A8C3WHT1_9CETA